MKSPQHYWIGEHDCAPKPYHYTECGLSNVFLLNGFTVEERDGVEYVSVENIDGLWKAIGLNLAIRTKVLIPKEIRFLRQQMDKTQAELAALLRVDDQTVARWEKGKAKLSGPADIALRILYFASEVAQPEGKEVLDQLMKAVEHLVGQDSVPKDAFLFHHQDNCAWNAQRMAA